MNLKNRIDRLARTRSPLVVVIIGGFFDNGERRPGMMETVPVQRDDEDRKAFIDRLTKEAGAIHTKDTAVVHVPCVPREHALHPGTT